MPYIRISTENKNIFAVSFIILFTELLIIRLIGTEIRIFAYLSNVVLLATFIGLGLGMIINKQFSIITSAFLLFLVVIAASSHYIVRWPNLEFRFFPGVTELLAPLSESYIWLQPDSYSKVGVFIGLLLLLLLFVTIIFIFLPLGQILGRLLSEHKRPIQAYSINIFASLLGMWFFQAFSLARFTPYFGIVLILIFLYFFVRNQSEKLFLLTIIAVTVAFIVPKLELDKRVFWSPYQKLSLSLIKHDQSNPNPQPGGFYLEVNNVGYMSLLNLSKEYHDTADDALKKLYKDSPINSEFSDQYYLPFRFKPHPRNVLIIGAGAGNDAAAAVRAGRELGFQEEKPNIDAVEIDPLIIEIGKNYHNEKPYSQQNVRVIVDDGRSFIQKTSKKYDVIIMGLADSHTLSSSLTNLRLDHYLYTRESLTQIKELLADDGVFFLTFEVTRPWIGQRINRSIIDAFGQNPKIFEVRSDGVYGWGGFFFIVGKNPDTLRSILAQNQTLGQFIAKNKKEFVANINPLTDDWPYLYLDKPRLPVIHLIIAAIIGVAFFPQKKIVEKGKNLDWPMFFWGAAFLLFEFQNISKTSLLFGTTWVTNLFTISAILILLLLANWAVQKNILSVRIAFVLLLVTIIIQILVPLRVLNSFAAWQKIVFASIFLNLPLFFGGMVFTKMFTTSKDKALAFGSNFLGSVAGGLLEMFSYLFGIQSLLFIVFFFYSAGFLLYVKRK